MDLAKIRKKLKEEKKKKAGGTKKDEKDKGAPLPEEPDGAVSSAAPINENPPPIAPELPQILEEAHLDTPASEGVSTGPQLPASDKTENLQPEISVEAVMEGEGTESFEEVKEEANSIEFLQFRLANEDYAIRVSEIGEILKPHTVTAVPRLESYVLGVSSLRGKVIPLIDLKKRLGLDSVKAEGNGKKERIVTVNGPKGLIGAWVDSVVDVLRIPEEMLQEPPGHLSEAEARFIEGTALCEGKFISIIRISEALNIDMDH